MYMALNIYFNAILDYQLCINTDYSLILSVQNRVSLVCVSNIDGHQWADNRMKSVILLALSQTSKGSGRQLLCKKLTCRQRK